MDFLLSGDILRNFGYLFEDIPELVNEYHEECKKKGAYEIYLWDTDKTGIDAQAAQKMGASLLKDKGRKALRHLEIKPFYTGLTGAIGTYLELCKGNETGAFEKFAQTVYEADISPEEFEQLAKRVVDKHVNPSFDKTLKEIQDAYNEILSKEYMYQKPFLILKTTGFAAVPAALHEYLRESDEFNPKIDTTFDVRVIGNPYQYDVYKEINGKLRGAQTLGMLSSQNLKPIITEENQVEYLNTWLEGTLGANLAGTIAFDDRMTFAGKGNSWAFIASNLAKPEVKKKADYVMQ